MNRTQEMQRHIRQYKSETGEREVDLRKVAKWAVGKGWPLPKPIDPLDRIARDFARAARQEVRKDKVTGLPYRANHAIATTQGSTQLTLWIDIDEAQRGPMVKTLVQRREQVVSDCVQLSLDLDHWNRVNPDEEPIQIPLDFSEDVEERMNEPKTG